MVANSSSGNTGGHLQSIQKVLEAIDTNGAVPESATAHEAAATLLSYFKALPQPFFPESVSTVSTLLPSCPQLMSM
jgi:hypothetical protein